MRVLVLFIIYILHYNLINGQISGQVIDMDGLPLTGASIMLLPDSTITTSDVNGEFTFSFNNAKTSQILLTSYIGYKNDTTIVTNGRAKVRITLVPDQKLIETIVITEEHAKLEATLQTKHLTNEFIYRNLEGNLSQTLEKLPGISAINVGVGIAKPIIRGLSSNRIIVNHNGIKQESQQWGSDHGLEIDQFDVERIEIIKGPGSLQYGSDGLGGVINILPDVILPKNSFKGSITTIHKTNNDHWAGSVKIGTNINDWFITARYSRQDFADYQVPAEIFTYNNFDLPIVNNRLKNTAGDESNINISTGLKRSWGVTRILYSHYSLDAGLFSGAVGIPRSYALEHDGNYRDIDVPNQNVNHYKLFLNQSIFFKNGHLVFDIGLQRNDRKEFSEPEFHSIPLSQLEDPNDKLAIELQLETFSVASHYEHQLSEDWKNIVGINAQWQNNRRGGFEYLLPDFKTFRGGLFSIIEKNISKNWLINGGVRFDIGQNTSDYYRQYVWDSNENIIDSLVSPSTDDIFRNWSASIGSNLSVNDGIWILKANIGKSFRVPYPAETVSNGIHHGTFRHEVGAPDLKSEHGYQLDLAGDWNYKNLKGSLSFYFNYFDNYIYLGPMFPAQFSKLPEAGQIFQYRQDDAIYTGFEFEWDWYLNSSFGVHQAIDFVQSYNPKTKLALPFTPQPSIRTDINFKPYKYGKKKDTYVEVTHQYHMAAKGNLRVDRSEKETPSYHLFGIGLGSSVQLGNQAIKLKIHIKNIFNTKYLSHLSRYRIINVPEQGRNVVVSIHVPFRYGI